MFTAPNDDDHFAIGAVMAKQEPPQPVGIGRYIRLHSEGTLAEVALTIVDAHHGHGLGSLMLGVLAKHAVLNGVSTFTALVHDKNEHMLNLLENIGAEAMGPQGHEIDFRMPLHSDASQYPDTPTGDAFRTAYRLARMH
jgi:RimJ/RimL family protein N-acetyltransferase